MHRKRSGELEKQNKAKAEGAAMNKAMTAFLKRLPAVDVDRSGTINKRELKTAIEQVQKLI